MEIFTVQNLTFRYPGIETNVLQNVCMRLNEGTFTVLCGPSGCGKSTLLHHFKTVLMPYGVRSGEILFRQEQLTSVSHLVQSKEIGFVGQSPDNQIVTDKVWHELAFGLESLGLDGNSIRRRVAEMANFFGIQNWFHKNTSELSGGQKQLLNLASVMVMQPSILILDEPTSQLDPIAASSFLQIIGRINRELGITVLMTEHRLEEVIPLCNSLVVMDNGRLLYNGNPRVIGKELLNKHSQIFLSMPTAMRVWVSICQEENEVCPLTTSEGRQWLKSYAAKHTLLPVLSEKIPACESEPSVVLRDVWYRYERNLPDVLKGFSLRVHPGEFLAVMGGNGAGKSTLLSILSGSRRAYRGSVQLVGKTAVLPQNPKALFTGKTVLEDLQVMRAPEEEMCRVLRVCQLGELLYRHPFDLSGGEQQRVALAKILLLKPLVLLLDEPTKGLDAEFKEQFAHIINLLLSQGVTVVMVSHDIEFCASHVHRCVLLFDGQVVSMGTPRSFFAENRFYTTAASRMAEAILPGAITATDIIKACGGDVPHNIEDDSSLVLLPKREYVEKKKRLPFWRKLLAGVGGLWFFIVLLDLFNIIALPFPSVMAQWKILFYATPSLAIWMYALAPACNKSSVSVKRKKSLPKHTIIASILSILLIPVTIFVGIYAFADQKFLFISLLVLLESMFPFFFVFEGRRPQARELVLIAVLCALCVAGRTVFYVLPQFKPVIALVILVGASLGGESGFLVGSLSMLLSNILFQQGPWTPWQMFAMGLIGLLSGFIFYKGILRTDRVSVCIFGFFSAIVIYGGIMNFSSLVLMHAGMNLPTILSYYAAGLPMDIIQAVATVFFLFLAANPMLEKLERMKKKYGLYTKKPPE